MSFRITALLYCAVLWSPLTATAQQRATAPGPAHPGVAVPAIKYDSAFTGYTPFREEKLLPWRGVNDEAAQVGGHLGIFSGAAGHAGHSMTKPAVQAPVTSPKPATPDGPHVMHGNDHQGVKK